MAGRPKLSQGLGGKIRLSRRVIDPLLLRCPDSEAALIVLLSPKGPDRHIALNREAIFKRSIPALYQLIGEHAGDNGENRERPPDKIKHCSNHKRTAQEAPAETGNTDKIVLRPFVGNVRPCKEYTSADQRIGFFRSSVRPFQSVLIAIIIKSPDHCRERFQGAIMAARPGIFKLIVCQTPDLKLRHEVRGLVPALPVDHQLMPLPHSHHWGCN